METTTQSQILPLTPSAKLSPLKQHPITSDLPPSPDATRTIFLDHPSARWSSSPASSPRIVNASPERRGSVYPTLNDTMQKGLEPGADFFDDGSSGSEWEDSECDMTQTLSDAVGLGLRSLMPGIAKQTDNASRGRSRRRSGITALPPFKQPPTTHSGLNVTGDGKLSSPVDANWGTRARPVSLTRLSKDNVRIVHTSKSNTPRSSLRSNSSGTSSTFAAASKLAPDTSGAYARSSKGNSVLGRHRRNTSESILAGSIIDAHVMTMRALESLNLSPSSILVDPNSQASSKRPSFTDERHIKLSPLAMHAVQDHDRPAHLPTHFVRTPYPFSAKKEFPKPKDRPRSHGVSGRPYSGDADGFIRLDSGYGEDLEKKGYDDRKGKHVLGLMASDGEYDLRSRLERNEDVQGITRSRAGSGSQVRESAVWLSLERRSWRKSHNVQAGKLVKATIPSSFTTSSPSPEKKKGNSSADPVDFDDAFFAERLRAGHRELAGNFVQRKFSARKLRRISLGNVRTWSGTAPPPPGHSTTSGLLAVGAGLDFEARSPFTEDRLMRLYRKPNLGKARYTWVHWARRVAASNNPQGRPMSESDSSVPEFYTTIQFVHTLSVSRILCALTLMLVLSVAAALLWIFLGPGGMGWRTAVNRERSERVGSGMAVGILVLLFEGMGFFGWIWCS